VAALQMKVMQAKAQMAQSMADAGAQQAVGSPLLQRWQVEPESLSTQSSGCYSAPSCDGSASMLEQMYCFVEQEVGSYTYTR
jgi:LOB domain-containing protein 16